MPYLVAVWLSGLLFSSATVASPLLAGSPNTRSPSIPARLVSKASIPRAVAVPSPIQTGISSSCTQYYQAQAGDWCETVAAKYNIPTSTFESWNLAVGSTCSQLLAGYYYCVASSTGNLTSVGQSFASSKAAAATTVVSAAVPIKSSQSTVSNSTCESALPDYTDPNAGPLGDEKLVCTVYEADFSICSATKPCTGNATFYQVSGGYTACGGLYNDSQEVAALSSDYVMGLLSSGNPANPYCNSTITVAYGTKSIPNIPVVDKCAGCKSVGHIDLSHGAYDALVASEVSGHIEITWHFDF